MRCDDIEKQTRNSHIANEIHTNLWFYFDIRYDYCGAQINKYKYT